MESSLRIHPSNVIHIFEFIDNSVAFALMQLMRSFYLNRKFINMARDGMTYVRNHGKTTQ